MANQLVKIGEIEVEVPGEIVEKARRLFAERIEQFFKDVELIPVIEQNLFRLQLIIFLIDVHYEQNWNYNEGYLADCWMEIENSLRGLVMGDQDIADILSEIRKYEEVEQNIRNGKKLREYQIDEFYFLKSCDVRLQRRLIRYLNTHDLSDSSDAELDFDILGEILDDIEDLEEDRISGFNGNRLLEMSLEDSRGAMNEYINFVISVQRRYYIDSSIFKLAAMILECLDKLLP